MQFECTLTPLAPYDFPLSAMIFSGGDPRIRIYDGVRFRQLLLIGDRPILVSIVSEGSVEEPRLRVRLVSEGPLLRQERVSAGKMIGSMMNLSLDLTPFYRQVAGDPVMGPLSTRLRGLRSPRTPTVFESLIESVIEQQISLPAARSLEWRLVRRFGRSADLEGFRYFAFPTPLVIAPLSLEDLRKCGLSRRKAEYLHGISQSIVSGTLDLEGLASVPDTAAVISRLTEIRGVGQWTAELTALRGLSRYNAFPAEDLGLRKTISHFYASGRSVDAGEARRISGAWGAWKGLAAFYLIIAEHSGIRPTNSDRS